jgi:hypothetical protein
MHTGGGHALEGHTLGEGGHMKGTHFGEMCTGGGMHVVGGMCAGERGRVHAGGGMCAGEGCAPGEGYILGKEHMPGGTYGGGGMCTRGHVTATKCAVTSRLRLTCVVEFAFTVWL